MKVPVKDLLSVLDKWNLYLQKKRLLTHILIMKQLYNQTPYLNMYFNSDSNTYYCKMLLVGTSCSLIEIRVAENLKKYLLMPNSWSLGASSEADGKCNAELLNERNEAER